MKRSDLALREAPDLSTFRRVPRASFAGTVYREHADRLGDDRGCWWYSSTPGGGEPEGRFDLEEPADDREQRRGTLYVAETPAASARERCGRFLAARAPIPETLVVGRVVSSIVGEAPDLGDLTHPDAALIGVTGEIHSVNDYRLTATWAAAADALGLAGLKYLPRFTPGGEVAYALFGPAGPTAPEGFLIVGVRTLAEVLVEMGAHPRAIPQQADVVDDEAEIDEL